MRERFAPEVAGGPAVRRIYVMEFSADDLHGRMITYSPGFLGAKHKVGESSFAYGLSDSVLTTKETLAGGTWSTHGITNSIRFTTITAQFRVSIDGDTLTQLRTEMTFEQDGKLLKQVTTPVLETWKRER